MPIAESPDEFAKNFVIEEAKKKAAAEEVVAQQERWAESMGQNLRRGVGAPPPPLATSAAVVEEWTEFKAAPPALPPEPTSQPVTAPPIATRVDHTETEVDLLGALDVSGSDVTRRASSTTVAASTVSVTVPTEDLLGLVDATSTSPSQPAVTPQAPDAPATSSKTPRSAYAAIQAILRNQSSSAEKQAAVEAAQAGVDDPALQVFAAMCKGILAATGDGASEADKTAAITKVSEKFSFIGGDGTRDADQTNQSIVTAMGAVGVDEEIAPAIKDSMHRSSQKVLTPIYQAALAAAASQASPAVAAPAVAAAAATSTTTPAVAAATPSPAAAATSTTTPAVDAEQSSSAKPAASHDADHDAAQAGAAAAAKGAAALILALAAGPAGWALAAGFLYVTRNVGVKKSGPEAPQEEMSAETRKCVEAYEAYEKKQSSTAVEASAAKAVTPESSGVAVPSSAFATRTSTPSVEVASTALGVAAASAARGEAAAAQTTAGDLRSAGAALSRTTESRTTPQSQHSAAAAVGQTQSDGQEAAADISPQPAAPSRLIRLFSRKKSGAAVQPEAAQDSSETSAPEEEPQEPQPTLRQRVTALFSRRDGYEELPDDDDAIEEQDTKQQSDPSAKPPSLMERGATAIRDFRRSRRRTDDPLLGDTDDDTANIEVADVEVAARPSRLTQMAASVRGVFSRGSSSRVDPLAAEENSQEGGQEQGEVHVAGETRGRKGRGDTTGTRGMENDDVVMTVDPRGPMDRAREAVAGVVSRLIVSGATQGGEGHATKIKASAQHVSGQSAGNQAI